MIPPPRLSLLLLLLSLLPSSSPVQVDQCTLRCKDNHMSQSMENEWSSDFTLPVMNILRRTGNETAAYLKVVKICKANQDFDACLSQCNATVEAAILRTGLLSWKDACENLDEMRQQFPCWKQFGDGMTLTCREYTLRLRQGLELLSVNRSLDVVGSICSEFIRFSGCHTAEMGKHCGYMSEVLSSRMFDSSKESIFQMLKLRFETNLPPACSPSSTYRRDVNVDYLQSYNSAIGRITIGSLYCILVLIHFL